MEIILSAIAPGQTPPGMHTLEAEILEICNQTRIERHCPALKAHKGLSEIAKRHAIAVAEGQAPFSHAGAQERFAACSTKCINLAENLARIQGVDRPEIPNAVVTGWIESEGHRRNLLGPFDICGLGWAASDSGVIFITQLLALADERSHLHNQLREGALTLATSSPVVCGLVGLAMWGPAGAVGTGLLGTALDHRYGVKASGLPFLARERFRGLLRVPVCSSCGTPTEKNLRLTAGDCRLLCAVCHPVPDEDDWCFV
mmetsp:Transcript_8254/g.18452  ORF Transcript_8254/g.18452 Transcript_8254/m.18452 type:complete len:258 (+) Transcript_8254:102-875(+)|eukprot:CAMPEP_0178380170 /NCGR_PEP_ID=MMETSP0689_2-20121128/5321_1 /TAXON_ID=160604 /ORGANISM="Amphidinium massartii, Strain CS-259" /LENGTH=257 /DNA_ID=CAMNT_0020000297 /DNA_START=177 /DNA_END=950 /DNA_ORIENTATION=-